MKIRLVLVLSVLIALLGPVLWSEGRAKKADVRKEPASHQVAAAVQLQVEVIEMSHEQAVALLRSHAPAADATSLRDAVQRLVGKGEAHIADTVLGVTDFAGKVKMHSVQEYFFATEYEPPEVPNKVSLSFGKREEAKWKDALMLLMTPPTPTAVERKNLGIEFEADVNLADSNRSIEVDFQLAHTALTGTKSWQEVKDSLGNKYQLTMPLFYINHLASKVKIRDGEQALMGVLSPKGEDGEVDMSRKLLVFLKGDVLEAKKQKAAPPVPDLQVQIDLLEVDHPTLQNLLGEPALVKNGTRLRIRLEELIARGEAQRFDTLLVRTSSRAEITSVREWIYPTEYEPLELAVPTNGVEFGGESTFGASHSEIPVPTAFETRDVGAVMRVDATMKAGGMVELDWEAGYTELAGLVSHGRRKTLGGNVYDVLMPDIDSMEPAGILTLKAGGWKFLAVAQQPKKPGKRLLLMLRTDLLR